MENREIERLIQEVDHLSEKLTLIKLNQPKNLSVFIHDVTNDLKSLAAYSENLEAKMAERL